MKDTSEGIVRDAHERNAEKQRRLDPIESAMSRLITQAAIHSPSRDAIDGMITQFTEQFQDVAVIGSKDIQDYIRTLRTRLEEFMDRSPKPVHVPDISPTDLSAKKVRRSAIKVDAAPPESKNVTEHLAIARWIEEHAENLAGLDARMIAGLAINNLKKKFRADLSMKERDSLVRYVQSWMTTYGMPQPTKILAIPFPRTIEKELEGIVLDEKELRALLYLLKNAMINESAKPEAVGIATGEIEFDDDNARECPRCVLTLKEKLQDTKLTIDIEIAYGKIYRGKKRQGQRVLSISLCTQK